MKFIFFGTPEFTAIILEKIINAGFIPEAVVCNPDKPVGRKKIITSPATKLVAQKYDIPVLQPEILANYKLQITNYKPDFFIVAAYNKILPKEILEIPRFGIIGVHPSLLPKYRGATPIQSVILNGDEMTGTTLYLMDEKMDHGPILASRELEFPISNFQFPILQQKLAELSADLLIEFLRKMNQYLGSSTSQKLRNIKEVELPEIKLLPQDESRATYTKKFATEDAFIEPKDLEMAQQNGGEIALQIERKIRALNPEPGVWTIINPPHKFMWGVNEKRVKLLESQIIDGKLKLIKIQIEGKKPTTLF